MFDTKVKKVKENLLIGFTKRLRMKTILKIDTESSQK